jgi:hypothetical protein
MTGGETKGTKEPETLTKPSPLLWRQRLAGLPKTNKWILAVIFLLILLLVILISVAALRANTAIDIGTLIISGKYINTITSCGHIQG